MPLALALALVLLLPAGAVAQNDDPVEEEPTPRFEEEIVVTPTGHEVITRFPAEELLVAGAPFVAVGGTLPTVRDPEPSPNPDVVELIAAGAREMAAREADKTPAGR